jgi:hypothetical protein
MPDPYAPIPALERTAVPTLSNFIPFGWTTSLRRPNFRSRKALNRKWPTPGRRRSRRPRRGEEVGRAESPSALTMNGVRPESYGNLIPSRQDRNSCSSVTAVFVALPMLVSIITCGPGITIKGRCTRENGTERAASSPIGRVPHSCWFGRCPLLGLRLMGMPPQLVCATII